MILSEGSGGINLTVKNQVRGTFQAEGEEYTGPKAGEAMKEKKKKKKACGFGFGSQKVWGKWYARGLEKEAEPHVNME